MSKKKMIRFVSLGGLLTALTVLFQSAPIFLPAIGLMLSPFSTLPIAIAATMNQYLGMTVLASSTLILVTINPQEALILIFATGFLGFVLGSLVYNKGALVSILVSALSLSLGMVILTYIAAIPAFVEFAETISFTITIGIYTLFSLVYVSIWFLCLHKFKKLFAIIKRME